MKSSIILAAIATLCTTLVGCTRQGASPIPAAPLSSGAGFGDSPAVSSYHMLYSFGSAGAADGLNPKAAMLARGTTFYGTTLLGGKNAVGTVFQTDAGGSEKVLASFAGGNKDGAGPSGGLAADGGLLYGTTTQGGTKNEGTVFSVTKTGTEKPLHSFTGSDGSGPQGAPLFASGTLYVTVPSLGAHGDGTIVAVTTTGSSRVLHSFAGGKDGVAPTGKLLPYGGTFYGVTSQGGIHSDGTIFSITPDGSEKVLYAFAGPPKDGSGPEAGPILVNGAFYGTTVYGGLSGTGTVYSSTPAGKVRILCSFGSGKDGQNPYAGVVSLGSTLYGVTAFGGNYGDGTIFSVTLAGKRTTLHNFGASTDGANPVGGLIAVSGTLYGTTANGGAHGNGTIFSLKP